MPTIKQNKIVENLSETVGSKGELLRKSGYSDSTSLTPHRILGGKGLQQLADKAETMGINDELTLSKVKKAIESNNLNLAINTIFNWWRVIYPNEKPDTQVNIQINQTPLTDEQRADYAYEVLARVHKKTVEEVKERLG